MVVARTVFKPMPRNLQTCLICHVFSKHALNFQHMPSSIQEKSRLKIREWNCQILGTKHVTDIAVDRACLRLKFYRCIFFWWIPIVMVNFNVDSARSWSAQIFDQMLFCVVMRVFLNEINIWIYRLSKASCSL